LWILAKKEFGTSMGSAPGLPEIFTPPPPGKKQRPQERAHGLSWGDSPVFTSLPVRLKDLFDGEYEEYRHDK
jgi:hypothetical protein